MFNPKYSLKKDLLLLFFSTIFVFVIICWLNRFNHLGAEEIIAKSISISKESNFTYNYFYKASVNEEGYVELFDNYSVLVKNNKPVSLSGRYLGNNVELLTPEINEVSIVLPYQLIKTVNNLQIDKISNTNHYLLSFDLESNPYMLDFFWDNLQTRVWIDKKKYFITRVEIQGSRRENKNIKLLLLYEKFSYIL
jgi:hypothetical protein